MKPESRIKLPDFTKHAGFNSLRARMGADLISYEANSGNGRISRLDLRRLETTGIFIELDEIETLKDGTFSYEGERVVLYIFSPRSNEPRFHIANCSTWDMMKSSGRQDRYVVSKRIDGNFEIEVMAMDKFIVRKEVRLKVCQHCLYHVGWKNYTRSASEREKLKHVNNFSLQEFFAKFPKSRVVEKPRWTPKTVPTDSYTDDFTEISSSARKAANWRCIKCQRTFAQTWQRRYLHTHHLNGNRGDNGLENLRVLCIGCHANEPMHSHLKNSPDYKKFIQLFNAKIGEVS